jgi:hypothetical protein
MSESSIAQLERDDGGEPPPDAPPSIARCYRLRRAGLFSSLYFVAAGRFPEPQMCESIGDDPNQRLSHAGFVAGDFAGGSELR